MGSFLLLDKIQIYLMSDLWEKREVWIGMKNGTWWGQKTTREGELWGFRSAAPTEAAHLGSCRPCPAGSPRCPAGGSSGASCRARMETEPPCCAPTTAGLGSRPQTAPAGRNLGGEDRNTAGQHGPFSRTQPPLLEPA